jgi:hypothetical protein
MSSVFGAGDFQLNRNAHGGGGADAGPFLFTD